jgi:peptide/nickel transport system ATP-binding protein
VSNVLEVSDLSVEFYPGDSQRQFEAVCDASLSIGTGELLGVVGESGCGKSVTALSLMGLLPAHARASGEMKINGETYTPNSEELSTRRGRTMGMIFQEPMSALNPVFSVGQQLAETLEELRDIEGSDRIRDESVRLLRRVQLDRPKERLEQYPHELSGGQRQRVMIALALAGKPDLLIADEPTTALDVTLEAGIMDLFQDLADDGLGVLLISHDLALVGSIADRMTVMYSGYTVETGPASAIMDQPQHPYTQGLVASSTALTSRERDRLPVISGEVPSPDNRPSGCPFHPRCDEKEDRCEREFPEVFQPVEDVETACWAREHEAAKKGAVVS